MLAVLKEKASPQVLLHIGTSNHLIGMSNLCRTWKGGDFMETEQDPERQVAIKTAEDAMREHRDAISRMEWEGPYIEIEPILTISPVQEEVPDARQDPTHPLRKDNQ